MSIFDAVDLGRLAEKSILILSDAYPPYSAGGAEVSLSTALAEVGPKRRQKAVVVAFSREVQQVELSKHHLVTVLHVPAVAAWPYESMFEHRFHEIRQRIRIGERNLARLIRLKKTALNADHSAAMLAYREARFRPKGGIMIDHLLSDEDQRMQVLDIVVKAMDKLELVVADNTRSILLVSQILDALPYEPASVAVVRDNRFHCPRPSQNRMVQGRFCEECRFQCASEDVEAPGVGVRQETLKRTADFRQQALNRFDRVVVTSHELMRYVAPVLREGVEVERIPNSFGQESVIAPYISSIAQSARSRLLIVGMLNENKGQLEFVNQSIDWLKAHPDIVIVLAGRGGRISESIRDLTYKHNIEQQVQLIGFRTREEIYAEIRKSKIVVAPTVWPEPFGRVPLEAGIARRPVVAFSVGGLNESIIHNKTGLLIRSGEYKAMHEAIDYLLDNPEVRVEMEANAYNWIRSTYAPDKTTRLFAKKVLGCDEAS